MQKYSRVLITIIFVISITLNINFILKYMNAGNYDKNNYEVAQKKLLLSGQFISEALETPNIRNVKLAYALANLIDSKYYISLTNESLSGQNLKKNEIIALISERQEDLTTIIPKSGSSDSEATLAEIQREITKIHSLMEKQDN